jgi:hypothetical protein
MKTNANLERALAIKNYLKENAQVMFADLIFAIEKLNFEVEKTTFAHMLKQKKSSFIGINGGQFYVDTPAQVGQDILRVVNEFAFK